MSVYVLQESEGQFLTILPFHGSTLPYRDLDHTPGRARVRVLVPLLRILLHLSQVASRLELESQGCTVLGTLPRASAVVVALGWHHPSSLRCRKRLQHRAVQDTLAEDSM